MYIYTGHNSQKVGKIKNNKVSIKKRQLLNSKR